MSLNVPIECGQKTAFVELLLDDCYRLREISAEAEIKTVLDVGANVGLFGVAARAAFPNASIHAYEPNASLKPILCYHGRQVGFECFFQAVGYEAGMVSLSVDPQRSLLSSITPDSAGSIRQVSLSTALSRLGGDVDLVKLDCEGAEWRILRDRESWSRVRYLTLEYHLLSGISHDEIVRAMKTIGFRIRNHDAASGFGLMFAETRR